MSNTGPKIFIVADSEGPTGVAEYWARNLPSTSRRLRPFRELMTGDVNAAIQGCFDAGASAVVVKDDGFRDRNILPELLDPRAQLILSGGSLLDGLDEHFAGVMLVGFHAMEGATDAVLAHTWSSARRRRYWFNGREGGELAAYAIAAGHDHGVPIIMATGCTGLCREAHAWLGPDLVTVPVKQLRPDGTVDLFPAADTHPPHPGRRPHSRRTRPPPPAVLPPLPAGRVLAAHRPGNNHRLRRLAPPAQTRLARPSHRRLHPRSLPTNHRPPRPIAPLLTPTTRGDGTFPPLELAPGEG